MQIKVVEVGYLQTNCYFVIDEKTMDTAVIDPGDDSNRILDAVEQGGFRVKAILLTHGHFDHIGAVDALYRHSSAADRPRIVIHELDAPMLTNPVLNAGMGLMGREITAPPATDLVREGDELTLAGLKIQVLHTPGHTPGSVCYLIEGELFTGDTLFDYGWGRTDLPGGNEEQMEDSLRRLMPMVRSIPMHAGH